MKSSPSFAFLFALALAAVVSGCESKELGPQQTGSDAQHEADPGGGETWRATTRTQGAASSNSRPSWVTIKEEARLDASGRLLYSDTTVRDDLGSPEVRVVCEPKEHRVVIERAGRRVEWNVPGDEPWMLAPVRGPAGEPIATPVVAWAAWRSAKNNEWVRLVNPLEQRSFVVPRDQYIVESPQSPQSVIVVGDQPIEVDQDFVRRMTIGGTDLARGPGDIHGAFRFRGG